VSGLISSIAAILALGILIILHEAGHYVVARLSGMTVRRFSIGFGPAIARVMRRRTREDLGGEEDPGTEFRIGAVPLGGYVQIDGLNPHDGTDPRAPGSFLTRPLYLRFATILAGPLANYLVGFVLLFVFYAFFSFESLAPVRVARLVSGAPADKAGLRAGDLIVGTTTVAFELEADFRAAVQKSGGTPVELEIARNGGKMVVAVTPEPSGGGGFVIGIYPEGSGQRWKPMTLLDSAEASWRRLGATSASFLRALASLVTPGGCDHVVVSGPIGMVHGLSDYARRSWAGAIASVADISIILGLANILPIPALDGSRLLFLLVGFVRRKPIEPKREALVHAVGLAILLGLLVLISIADLLRLVASINA
jgi:regulator of sigma E protease